MDNIKNPSKTAYITRGDLLKVSYFGQQWFNLLKLFIPALLQ
jgi:hypothetical protein